MAAIVATAAVVGYLAFSFPARSGPTAHTSPTYTHLAQTVWRPVGARISAIATPHGGGVTLHVAPSLAAARPLPGARIPTIVAYPSPGRGFGLSMWLRTSSAARVGVEVTGYRPGAPSRVMLHKLVTIRRAWRWLSFRGRVTGGRWKGLRLFVYESGNIVLGSWFEVRGLGVSLESSRAARS